MITRDEVIWGYRLVLGREPENERAIEHHMQHEDLLSYRRVLLASDEFAQMSRLENGAEADLPFLERSILQQEKLIFLHLPKTGGTTLHHHLAQFFAKEDICPERFNRLRRLPVGQLARYRFISGHFDLASCEAMPGNKRIITFLREPRARLVSFYNFLKAHRADVVKRHGWGLAQMAAELSIHEFFAHPVVRHHPYINNGMTRALVDHLPLEVWSTCEPAMLSSDVSAAVDEAVALLKGLTAFGVVERFDQSAQLVTASLGLPACPAHERRLAFAELASDEANYRAVEVSRAEEVPEEVFEPLIGADAQLYRAALAILDERLAAQA